MERDYLRCLTISPSYLTDVSRYAGTSTSSSPPLQVPLLS